MFGLTDRGWREEPSLVPFGVLADADGESAGVEDCAVVFGTPVSDGVEDDECKDGCP